jgi:nucleoside-diphosphate-sugar epimerase
MKILLIGGTGFISSWIVKKLLERDHEVTVATRGRTVPHGYEAAKVKFAVVDRSSRESLSRGIGRATFDAVIDMVAYRPEESKAAIEALKGKSGRFVHCSTISVYMVSYEVQCPITEDQDKGRVMEYFPRNPFGMDYGLKKRECESVLWDAHDENTFPVTMLRPTFVCGPQDPAKRDFFWIERILDGGPLLVPGGGSHPFQSVYVEDVAAAFVKALDVPASVGESYNIVSEEIFSLNDYLGALSNLLGKRPELIHVDQDVFDALPFSTSDAGDVFPFNVRRTSVFSVEKAKRDLGFRSTPFRSWMPKTIEWFTRQFKGHSNGYERRWDEMKFAERWKKAGIRMRKDLS